MWQLTFSAVFNPVQPYQFAEFVAFHKYDKFELSRFERFISYCSPSGILFRDGLHNNHEGHSFLQDTENKKKF